MQSESALLWKGSLLDAVVKLQIIAAIPMSLIQKELIPISFLNSFLAIRCILLSCRKKYKLYNRCMFKICNEDLDLTKIADSGQCFRMDKNEDGSWTVIAMDKLCSAKEDGCGTVLFDCPEEDNAFWKEYFDLETDYAKFRDSADREDPFLSAAVDYGKGIRILRQDPWELSGCSLGYRAEYVYLAAQAVSSGEFKLEELVSLSDEDLLASLLKLKGVGVKVANCVSLFGFHRIAAFPIDVWIDRVQKTYYNGHFPVERYEGYAGIMQQYIFYYARKEL